jgi:cobalt-zinc-cadmium efflux system outer membrane protein
MKLFILIALSLHSLLALTLPELIDMSLQNNPSLEAIQKRIEANKKATQLSSQFSNPELLLTANTLKNSEPMSQTQLTLKQNIPFFGKRDAKEKIGLAEDELLEVKLKAAKAELVSEIKKEAYTLWRLRETSKIIDAYIALTQDNIELYESYSAMGEKEHMGIMKAQLSLSALRVQKSALKMKIDATLWRLSYLSAHTLCELTVELKMGSKPELATLLQSLVNNPDIAMQTKEIQKQQAKVQLASKENYPDINLIAGYAYRENFDDYLNFGVGVSLPIYGRESLVEQEARSMALVLEQQKKDVELEVSAELQIYYSQLLSAYEIYHIIQDGALPQVKHMLELSNSSFSTGGDLFKYIDVIFSKLDLEQKSINAVVDYNLALAKVAQLAGETK